MYAVGHAKLANLRMVWLTRQEWWFDLSEKLVWISTTGRKVSRYASSGISLTYNESVSLVVGVKGGSGHVEETGFPGQGAGSTPKRP